MSPIGFLYSTASYFGQGSTLPATVVIKLPMLGGIKHHRWGACAQCLVSPGGALCTTPCVTRAGPVRNALCGVHNALCHLGGPCAQRLVSPGGGSVRNAWGAQRLVSLEGPLRKALCHREACAQRLVSQRGRGVCLWLSGESNGLLTCQSWAQIPGGALCTTPCVGGGPVRNALCRATPCVAQRLVALGGGAQGLVSQRGLCATPCVTAGAGRVPVAWWLEQRTSYLSVMGSNPRGGPVHNALCQGGGLCTTPCVTGGACAQRLVLPGGGAQRLVSPGEAQRVCFLFLLFWGTPNRWAYAMLMYRPYFTV